MEIVKYLLFNIVYYTTYIKNAMIIWILCPLLENAAFINVKVCCNVREARPGDWLHVCRLPRSDRGRLCLKPDSRPPEWGLSPARLSGASERGCYLYDRHRQPRHCCHLSCTPGFCRLWTLIIDSWRLENVKVIIPPGWTLIRRVAWSFPDMRRHTGVRCFSW